MSDPGTVDEWIGDASKSMVPTGPGPSEDDLRRELESAPVVPLTGAGAQPPGQTAGRGARGGQRSPDEAASSGGDRGGRGRGRPRGEIYDDCPVRPLGVRGDTHYFLDVHGQLRGVKKLETQVIMGIFGHCISGLKHHFPYRTKSGVDRDKFDGTAAQIALYEAASECGLFNPDNAVRGVGAWKDEDGRLIYHMGDKMLIGGEEGPPQRLGRHIYPAYPPIPHPAPRGDGPDPVDDILDTLQTWGWARPDVHPHLALGMIGVQMMSGALDWRPVFWLTAAAGSGKSELQRMIRYLHGDTGLVTSEEATKSGITSKLGHSSLPVSLDELEPGDERSNKERDIIMLARIAASGGEWLRGSSDQTGVGGKVFSTFLFSSILIPGIMKAQDVQRLIRLDMMPLPKGTPKLVLTPRTWRARGARLKRLLIDRWPTWEARLSSWRDSLELRGVMGRDADNWSTVLAMADMALRETTAEAEERDAWAEKISWIVADDRADTTNDAEAMLAHLLGQPYDIYRRGEQFNLAQWIMAAAGLPGAPEAILGSDAPGDTQGDSAMSAARRVRAVDAKLAKAGLRVSPAGGGLEARLFIANTKTHWLAQFFQGSEWAGGAWTQSAMRVPGAERSPHPLTLAGTRSRGTFIPLQSIPGLAAFPMDRDEDLARDEFATSSAEDWS